jgi:plasmid maintenance system antidote protein VapI
MNNIDMTLERYSQEYKEDPEFIAEGMSIKIVEEMLELMEHKDLNQSWLAQKLGVSRAHISKILNAPPNMTLLTIAKIATALGATPDVSLAETNRNMPAVAINANNASTIRSYITKETEAGMYTRIPQNWSSDSQIVTAFSLQKTAV